MTKAARKLSRRASRFPAHRHAIDPHAVARAFNRVEEDLGAVERRARRALWLAALALSGVPVGVLAAWVMQ